MKTFTTGGPAFPTPRQPDSTADSDMGMALRDYFAAAALTGLLAAKEYPMDDSLADEWARQNAIVAYKMAKAMLDIQQESLREPGS
jgi:hypothetical protein